MKLTLTPFRYPVQLATLNAVRSGSAAKPEQPEQRAAITAPPVVAPEHGALFEFEYRTHLYQQQSIADDSPSARAQRAIGAYSSVTEVEERARLSEIFGLNEYA